MQVLQGTFGDHPYGRGTSAGFNARGLGATLASCRFLLRPQMLGAPYPRSDQRVKPSLQWRSGSEICRNTIPLNARPMKPCLSVAGPPCGATPAAGPQRRTGQRIDNTSPPAKRKPSSNMSYDPPAMATQSPSSPFACWLRPFDVNDPPTPRSLLPTTM